MANGTTCNLCTAFVTTVSLVQHSTSPPAKNLARTITLTQLKQAGKSKNKAIKQSLSQFLTTYLNKLTKRPHSPHTEHRTHRTRPKHNQAQTKRKGEKETQRTPSRSGNAPRKAGSRHDTSHESPVTR